MSPKPMPKNEQQDYLLICQVWILAIIAFLAPLIGGKLDPFGTGILRILALFTGMILLARVLKNSAEIRKGAVLWLSIILFALGLLSFANTVSIHKTLFSVLNLMAYLLVFTATASLPDHRMALGILASLLASAFIVSTLGVREYLLSAKSDWRTFATFFNPDFLAGFMSMVLPIMLAWYLSQNRKGISLAAGVGFLGILGAILLTGSRLGTLCAIGGVVFCLLFALAGRSFKKAQAARLIALILPSLLVLTFFSKPLTSRVFLLRSESYSGAFRIETWKGTIRIIKAHPVTGTGLGTFELIYPKYAHVGFTKMAHNSYLQLASESGTAAPIVLVLLIGTVSLFLMTAGLRQRQRDELTCDDWLPHKQLMLCGILGGVAASVARNLVDSDWYISAIGFSFAAILGIGFSLASEPSYNSFGLKTPKAVAVILFCLTICGIILSLLAITAHQFELRGNALVKNGNLDEAICAYRTAVSLDYLNSEHMSALGQAYAVRASIRHDASDLLKAEHFLLLATKRTPTSAKSYYQLGKLYEFAGKDKEALNAYHKALAWDKNAVQVLYAKAKLCERMGRLDEALKTYRRMVEIENSPYEQIRAMPEFVETAYVFAHYAIAKQLEKEGNLVGAVQEYKLSLDRIERFEKSLKEVGDILEASGKRDFQREAEIREIALDSRRRLDKLSKVIIQSPSH